MENEIKKVRELTERYIDLLKQLFEVNIDFAISVNEVDKEPNNMEVVLTTKSEKIKLFIGKKGRNAIAIRGLFAILLRKEHISKRVKLIFDKKSQL